MTKAHLFRNGHSHQYHFDGGYISFSADTVDGFYYYIQDYMGNNRMVVNGRTDSIEQITHYYPYGGVIGDISTNESLQKFKFEGKELDRTFGLDNYDIKARQYFAMAPMWDRVDPLAEKYYGISPYVYCGGNPVNCIDPDGRVVIKSNDARYIKACMSLTPTGQAVWNAMDATPYPISIIISNGTYNSNHPDGKSSSKNPLAVTNVTTNGVVDKNGEKSERIECVTIEFFQETIDDVFCTVQGTSVEFDNEGDPRSRHTKNMNDREKLTKEDVMGATATHEGVHATDPKSNKVGEPNKEKREVNPIKQEILFIQQLEK